MADNRYNDRPSNWIEISEEEFRKDFFSYILKPCEFRQITYDLNGSIMSGVFEAKLFDLYYKIDLGIAIVNDWKESKLKYFKYGKDDWNKFKGKFADQFKGDNS